MINQVVFDEMRSIPDRLSSETLVGDFSFIRSMTSQFLIDENRIDQKQLVERMRKFFTTQKEDNKEFFEGYLRAILDLIQEKNFRDLNEARFVRCLRKSAYVLPLLVVLENDGSMSHKELAKKLGLQDPRLTNLVGTLVVFHLFSSIKIGKEKFYSITAEGEELLQSFLSGSLPQGEVLKALEKINPSLKTLVDAFVREEPDK